MLVRSLQHGLKSDSLHPLFFRRAHSITSHWKHLVVCEILLVLSLAVLLERFGRDGLSYLKAGNAEVALGDLDAWVAIRHVELECVKLNLRTILEKYDSGLVQLRHDAFLRQDSCMSQVTLVVVWYRQYFGCIQIGYKVLPFSLGLLKVSVESWMG